MTPAEFEMRVQQLLDRRRDPLADRQCADFLAGHPDSIAFTARLLAHCAALPAVGQSLPRPRTQGRRGPWLGLAAAMAAACVLWLVAMRDDECEASTRRPAGRVLSASLEPILPRLQAAPTIRVRSVLLAEPRAEFEVFIQWSPR